MKKALMKDTAIAIEAPELNGVLEDNDREGNCVGNRDGADVGSTLGASVGFKVVQLSRMQVLHDDGSGQRATPYNLHTITVVNSPLKTPKKSEYFH